MKQEGNITNSEHTFIQQEYSRCDSYDATQNDLILAYPDSKLSKDTGEICQHLQRAYNVLCAATPISQSPTQKSGKRIAVGFRHADDEGGVDCKPGWWGPTNRVNVPYSYLSDDISFSYDSNGTTSNVTIDIPDNLEFCCSHELVHPFEEIFLEGKHKQNKKWKEGFCDCLRVLVLHEMGLFQSASDWEDFIKTCANSEHDEYHDAAGRIFLWLEGQDNTFRNNHAVLRVLIASLINDDMDTLLYSMGR